MNGTEYLEYLFAAGIKEKDLPVIQPIHQKKIWDKIKPGDGPEKLAKAIEECKKEDHRFHMEGGSWTNNISWVRGYDSLLGPMEQMSSPSTEVLTQKGLKTDDRRFRNALFHVMSAETSCYRYWGQGVWVDYGKEICRRAEEIINTEYAEFVAPRHPQAPKRHRDPAARRPDAPLTRGAAAMPCLMRQRAANRTLASPPVSGKLARVLTAWGNSKSDDKENRTAQRAKESGRGKAGRTAAPKRIGLWRKRSWRARTKAAIPTQARQARLR